MLRRRKEFLQKACQAVSEIGHHIDESHLMSFANELTLSLILAFFPFVMFLFTLLGFLNLDPTTLLQELQQVLPGSSYQSIEAIILDVVGRQHGELLSLSVVVAIYASSGGFRAFARGCNRILGIRERRNVLADYLLSVLGVIVLALTIVIVLLAMVFGRQILYLIRQHLPALPLLPLLQVLRQLVPIVLIFVILTAFYRFVPVRHVPIRDALSGALFTTTGWTILTYGFQYYVDTFANYSLFYGALGTLVALLIWVQLLSAILLLGVEVIHWRQKRHGSAAPREASPTPQLPAEAAGDRDREPRLPPQGN